MLFFMSLAGTIICLWSVLRVLHPSERFGLYDGVARLLFSAWMLWGLAQGMVALLWVYVATELAFAAAQLLPLARARRVAA